MYAPKDTVMAYLNALDRRDFESAASYLAGRVSISGPGGEAFKETTEFIGMLSSYEGRYEILKLFSDAGEVCAVYNYNSKGVKVYMVSLYRVEDGRITSIRTVFDPGQFSRQS